MSGPLKQETPDGQTYRCRCGWDEAEKTLEGTR